MGCEIVELDVVHKSSLSQLRDLVEFTEVVQHVGVFTNSLLRSLEVHNVNLIKADKSHIKPNISLRDTIVAHEVSVGITNQVDWLE